MMKVKVYDDVIETLMILEMMKMNMIMMVLLNGDDIIMMMMMKMKTRYDNGACSNDDNEDCQDVDLEERRLDVFPTNSNYLIFSRTKLNRNSIKRFLF